MFVGETGIGRIVQRTADVMAEYRIENPDQVRDLGVIDLPTIQRYLNFHYSVTLDLFGSDVSSNAATFFTTGLKGRYRETTLADDHTLQDATYPVCEVAGGTLVERELPALSSLNERLRDDYIGEVQAGVDRWNRHIANAGLPFKLTLPHKAFHRAIGNFAGSYISPDGTVMTKDAWAARRAEWLPGEKDYAFVQSLMAGLVPLPSPANPGDRVRVRLLSGVGPLDVNAMLATHLVQPNAQITIVGNADRFDYTQSQIVYYDDTFASAAVQLQQLLGVGEIAKRATATDTEDLTLIIGSDLVDKQHLAITKGDGSGG